MATVYIETTIVSYLTARPSSDAVLAAHQTVTRAWWRGRSAYELRVSQLVLDEASAGDSVMRARRLRALRGFPVLALTDSATHVAKELVQPHPFAPLRNCPQGNRHETPGFNHRRDP